jgi:hypothetical protein
MAALRQIAIVIMTGSIVAYTGHIILQYLYTLQ